MELIGVLFGISGAFMVANSIFQIGYIAFFFSSMLLSITAYNKRQYNLLALQLVFLAANINGLFTFWK